MDPNRSQCVLKDAFNSYVSFNEYCALSRNAYGAGSRLIGAYPFERT
jgi:hypothetical protein